MSLGASSACRRLAVPGLIALLAVLGRTASAEPAPEQRRIAGVDAEVLELDVPVLDLVAPPRGDLLLMTLEEAIDVEELVRRVRESGGIPSPADSRLTDLGSRRLLRWVDGHVETVLPDLGPGPGRLFLRGEELWWSEVRDEGPSRALRLRFPVAGNEPETAPGKWVDLEIHDRQGLLAARPPPDVARLTLLDDELREEATLPLPVAARRRGSALELRSYPVQFLAPEGAGGPGTWIVGPRVVDDRRLLVWILDPETGERTEVWCRLPTPEELSGHRIVELAGRPALVAWTTDAEKLGVFEKLRLRVWILQPDRTKAGRPPVLEHETPTRHWFRLDARTADFDGDGREELLLSQPRGLGGNELLVDVFPVSPSGRIGEPRSTDFDAPGASWDFGDVDGDGTPDLVVLDRNALTVRRGLADHRRRAFENRPFVEIPVDALPRAPAPPDAEDRDDAGDLELFVLPGAEGAARIVLTRTRTGGGSVVVSLRSPLPGA